MRFGSRGNAVSQSCELQISQRRESGEGPQISSIGPARLDGLFERKTVRHCAVPPYQSRWIVEYSVNYPHLPGTSEPT